MSKLGVITDGISRDFEHALQVMTDADLEYAELQFLWEKEVGDLNDDEMAKAQGLIDKFGVKVSCISRHNFVGMGIGDVEVGDANHQKHMDSTKRCIDMAKALDCPLERAGCNALGVRQVSDIPTAGIKAAFCPTAALITQGHLSPKPTEAT